MKHILSSVIFFSAALGLTSCSEDFQVTAPYKDITFITSMLNMADTAHYVRIQKAFLDENKSAIDMAKVSDSSFYNNLKVMLQAVAGTSVIYTDTLLKVNLNDEGFPKDSGAFFNNPNYAYKVKRGLNAAYQYRLLINNLNTGKTFSSQISLIDTAKFNIYEPAQLIFARTQGNNPSNLINFNIGTGSNISIINVYYRFHWVDRNIASGASTRKFADMLAGTATKIPGQSITVPNNRFYSFLADAMQPAQAGHERFLDSVDMFYYAGGIDYYNYLQVSSTKNSGVTADLSRPLFTNFQGDDVYGLFSSRAVRISRDIAIESSTLDSLKSNPVTKNLNIRGVTQE